MNILLRIASVLVLLTVSTSCLAITSKSSKLDYATERGFEFGTPAADEAVIVFLRPVFRGGLTASGAVNAQFLSVWENDDLVCIVLGRSHYVHRTSPGTHRYMLVSGLVDFVDADLEGGLIYFVVLDQHTGWLRSRFSFEPIAPGSNDWERLEEWLAESLEGRPNEEAREWATEKRAEFVKKREAKLPKWLEGEQRRTVRPEHGVERYPLVEFPGRPEEPGRGA